LVLNVGKTVAAPVFALLVGMAFAAPTAAISSIAALAIQETNSADAASIDEALEHIRGQDYDRGFIILQRLGGQGNGEALFHLGELFRFGLGREKSETVAVMYYRLSAALGHKRASLSLANMLFFEGDGTEKTYGEALSLWQNLALDGDLESTYMLGMIYWNGDAGVPQDPVRGYGLIWRAAQAGWPDAEQNELTMRSLLPMDAREAAMEYGRSLDVEGFSGDQLALDLILKEEEEPGQTAATADVNGDTASADAAAEDDDEGPLEKPDDWASVWRLEVGFAMSQTEIRRLRSIIESTLPQAVGELHDDVMPSVTRPGLFRLVYGPMRSMHQAVNTCVTLKRAGHDCTAQPPEED
jgi:TPR repeat protein